MESIHTSLYSDLIHQDTPNQQIENPNQSMEADPNLQEASHHHSKILTWNLNPSSSSSVLSIETGDRKPNPKSILEIISPKSTSTQFDSQVDPFEFFGQQRSQFIQRDLIQSNSHPNLIQENQSVDQTPKLIHHEYDDVDLSRPTLVEDSIKYQLDDLTKSFQTSTQLFHSDLHTPIQSFKKFKPLRLHSRLMNQSSKDAQEDEGIPRSCLSTNQASDEQMKEFLSPSYSIEEENQKVKIIISQEIQLSSNLNPLLSFKGEPISNLIKSNSFTTPLMSRKRKQSDMMDEADDDDDVSGRIKISNHSKKHQPASFKVKSNVKASIPSLAELRATMPPSSRRYYQPPMTPTKQS